MNDDENPFDALPANNDVQVIPPDFALKKKIGEDVDIKQYLNGEMILEAQKTIDKHKDNFVEWVGGDIAAIETCYQNAMANIGECGPEIKKLAKLAFVIKSQAGTFGYDLATRVAKSLDDFCTSSFKPVPEHLTVIRKHIDTLQVIFSKNITGDGGELGTQLLDVLRQLVEKYKK